jgi:L-galactose dehydrogenase
MDYHRLGKTGLYVSAVSFGTAPLGDMFDAADQGAAIKSVHLALEPRPVGPL